MLPLLLLLAKRIVLLLLLLLPQSSLAPQLAQFLFPLRLPLLYPLPLLALLPLMVSRMFKWILSVMKRLLEHSEEETALLSDLLHHLLTPPLLRWRLPPPRNPMCHCVLPLLRKPPPQSGPRKPPKPLPSRGVSKTLPPLPRLQQVVTWVPKWGVEVGCSSPGGSTFSLHFSLFSSAALVFEFVFLFSVSWYEENTLVGWC